MTATTEPGIRRLYAKYNGWIFPVLLFLIPFCVYCLCAPRTVTQEDSGRFILNAYFLGLNHPTGYPLHTLLGKLFILIAPGTAAFRVHLMNVFAGCATVVLVYRINLRLLAGPLAAFFGSLALAFAGTFWFQAMIAEVYMLTAVTFVGAFLVALRLEEEFRPRRWYLLCFLLGLSTTAHLSLAVFAFPALFFLGKKVFSLEKKVLLFGFFFFALGLAPYLHLVLAPLYTEYFTTFPLRTPGDLIDYLTRKGFRESEMSRGFTFSLAFGFLKAFFFQFVNECSPVGFVLALIGAWWAARRWKASWLWSVLWLLSYSLLIILFWREDYNYITAPVWHNLHLIPLVALSIFLTQGLDWILYRASPLRYRIALSTLLTLAVAGLGFFNLEKNYLRNDTHAEEHGRIVLESMPPGALLILWEIGPVGYLNKILGVRKDVTIVGQLGDVLPDKMIKEKDLSPLAKAMHVSRYISAHWQRGERVFSTHPFYIFPGLQDLPFRTVKTGLFFEILPGGRGQAYEFPASLRAQGSAFMDRFLDGRYPDNFPGDRRDLLLAYCRLFTLADEAHRVLEEPECVLKAAEQLAIEKRYDAADQKYRKGLKSAKLNEFPAVLRNQYHFSFFFNRLHWIEADKMSTERGRELLQQAIDLTYPALEPGDCYNPLIFIFRRLYDREDLNFDRQSFRRNFASCPGGRGI